MKFYCFILMCLFALPRVCKSQAPLPPIPFEVFAGNNGLFVQSVVKRPFSAESKFSFFNLGTYDFEYQSSKDADMVLVTQISYKLKKGFAIMGGGEMNNTVGFSPIVGVEHTYASREWLAVTILGYFTNSSSDMSLFGLYEFKPALNDQLSLYSRLQFMYNQSLSQSTHNRSFVQLRLGIKKARLRTGLALNLDQYGPRKIFKNNTGLFVAWEF